MGHRALIAVERNDGLYNVTYSHWGAHGLHLRDPLYEWHENGCVGALPKADDEPMVTSVPDLETVATDHLDYLHHEAFYVLPMDCPAPEAVGTYRTVWYGTLDDAAGAEVSDWPTVGHGALIAPRWYEGEPLEGVVNRIRGYQDALKDDLRADRVTLDDAYDRLTDYINGQQGDGDHPPRVPEFSPFAFLPPGVDGRVSDVFRDGGTEGR